jgi:RecG-like helicase
MLTVGAGKSVVASTLSVCNRGTTAATYRVAVRPSGTALANQHYMIFDASIMPKDTVTLSVGITMATTDVLTVYASSANLSFSLFGAEIS